MWGFLCVLYGMTCVCTVKNIPGAVCAPKESQNTQMHRHVTLHVRTCMCIQKQEELHSRCVVVVGGGSHGCPIPHKKRKKKKLLLLCKLASDAVFFFFFILFFSSGSHKECLWSESWGEWKRLEGVMGKRQGQNSHRLYPEPSCCIFSLFVLFSSPLFSSSSSSHSWLGY